MRPANAANIKINHAPGVAQKTRSQCPTQSSQIISRRMVHSTIWRKVINVHPRIALRITRVRVTCFSSSLFIRARCRPNGWGNRLCYRASAPLRRCLLQKRRGPNRCRSEPWQQWRHPRGGGGRSRSRGIGSASQAGGSQARYGGAAGAPDPLHLRNVAHQAERTEELGFAPGLYFAQSCLDRWNADQDRYPSTVRQR